MYRELVTTAIVIILVTLILAGYVSCIANWDEISYAIGQVK